MMGRLSALCVALPLAVTCFAGCRGQAPKVTSPPFHEIGPSPVAPLAAAPTGADPTPRLAFAPLEADPARKSKFVALIPELDRFFQSRVEQLGVTGGAIGIVLEGEIVYLRGFGVRDIVSKRPVDVDTPFRIGSVSKTFTALAIMRLRDAGKLSLDEPAAGYLPLLAALPLPTKDSPPITIRHLLTMTSGLPYDDLWGAVTFGYDDTELERFIARGVSFAGAPGERYRYSNLGYALLGQIVERVSGLSFEEFLTREVFAPLGMRSTGYVTGDVPRADMAVGYYRDADQLVAEPVESDQVFAAAGGVLTTISDLARYAAFQLSAYPPRDDPETGTVRRSTLREMHAGRAWARWHDDYPPLKLDAVKGPALSAMSYGFGWSQNTTCHAEAMVQHGGFEPGYYATVRLIPRQRVGIVSMSASENLGWLSDFERIVALLAEGGVLEAPPPPASPALASAREIVIRLLNTWDPELVQASFDPLTQRYSFVRNFESDMRRMSKDHGNCRPAGSINALSLTHGRFRLECDRGAIDFLAYLTPGVPPVVQMVEWREELPVGAEQRILAGKLAAAVSRGVPPAGKIFAASIPQSELVARFASWHADFGQCELGDALWHDAKGKTTARLTCSETRFDLSFRSDPKTSLITELSGARPHAPGAICVY